MKKIIAIVLALVMSVGAIFTMASCAKKDENTLVCGVTIIPGLNEKDSNGNWTGFETEFAQAVGKELGMNVEFKEIKWANKYIELESGKIDCVWNGFTANAAESDGKARSSLVDFSYGYMLNQQCVVVRRDQLENYTSEASLEGKRAAVETGSAGDTYAQGVKASDIMGLTSQIDTFLQLKSGKVDFLVVDIILAQNMCGNGSYEDLAIVEDIKLDSEIYAVGFKKGSELTAKVNAAIKKLDENGTLMEIAKEYKFENVVKVIETIE